MPGGIVSNWKLTLDPAGTPLVLINIGDKLEEELSIGLSRLIDVIPLVRGTAPLIRNRGNAVTQLSYAIYQDAASDAVSRQDLLTSLITSLSADPKPLKVEISTITDRYWQFASAIISDVTPLRYIPAKNPRRLTRYSITATSLSQVGP
jgi:hypothetical protein